MNAHELNKIIQRKKDIRKQIYRELYHKIFNTLKKNVEVGRKRSVVVIPRYLMGFPPYDIVHAGEYLRRQFVLAGFECTHSSGTLVISLKKMSKAAQTTAPSNCDDFSSLVNLKSIASQL